MADVIIIVGVRIVADVGVVAIVVLLLVSCVYHACKFLDYVLLADVP